jgi:hypothetical protein
MDLIVRRATVADFEVVKSLLERCDLSSHGVLAPKTLYRMCQARSCLIYAFAAPNGSVRPASIAGPIGRVVAFRRFMRQLLVASPLQLAEWKLVTAVGSCGVFVCSKANVVNESRRDW